MPHPFAFVAKGWKPRLIATGGMSYIYDGDGKRVEKCTQGTTAGTCATNATSTLYWRGWGDEVNTDTDLAGNTTENYIHFNGQRIARRDVSTGAVHYYFSDHLGTHSLVTDVNGTMPPQEESDFYPYGGEIPVSGSDPNHYKFTGKERDSESGLDNFGARYDASTLGRFMTPDWAAKPTSVPYAKFGDPETLNLYSYVQNGPVNRADLDGHGDYYSPGGAKLGSDGFKDGNVYIAPAGVTKTADGKVSAAQTFTSISVSASVGVAIQDSVARTRAPSGADTRGGFHEEGFTVDNKNEIHTAKPGPAVQPGDHEAHLTQRVTSSTTIEEHTHPAGTQNTPGSTTIGGIHADPKPSDVDMKNAGSTPEPGQDILHIEASAGNQTVYFYDDQGVNAQVPLSAFPDKAH